MKSDYLLCVMFRLASVIFCPHLRGMSDAPSLTEPDSLQGKLLIAMPGLEDSNFDHSVIYLCQHDAESSMGLVLNQPIIGLDFGRMLEELGIPSPHDHINQRRIFSGGPVQNERGFVLHSLDYFLDDVTLPLNVSPEDLDLSEGLGLTVSRDILEDLSKDKGPSKAIVALGFAGWGAGQLEAEIRENAWLVAPASHDIIFTRDPSLIWQKALKAIGISPEHLSSHSGRA